MRGNFSTVWVADRRQADCAQKNSITSPGGFLAMWLYIQSGILKIGGTRINRGDGKRRRSHLSQRQIDQI